MSAEPSIEIYPKDCRTKVEAILRRLWTNRVENGFTATLDLHVMRVALQQLAAKKYRPDDHILFRALCQLPQRPEPDLQTLERAIYNEKKDAATRLQRSKLDWRIALPIALQIEPPRLSVQLTVLDTPVLLTSSKRALAWFYRVRDDPTQDNQLKSHLRRHRTWQRPTTLLHVRASGSVAIAAVNNSWRVIDTVRGCLEFTFGCGGITHSSGSTAHTRAAICDYIVTAEAGGTVDGFLVALPATSMSTSDFQPRAHRLESGFYRRLKQYAGIVAKADLEGTTRELLSRAFRLYSNAMEQVSDAQRLLCWWQLAECLTLSSRFRGDTKRVIARLAWMATHRDVCPEAVMPALEAIAGLRNDFVHQADSTEITEDHSNNLKMLCDLAMLWLTANVGKLPTLDHLDRVLDLRASSRGSLQAMSESVKFLMDLDR